MTDLVTMDTIKEVAVTTSLKIAENFEKRHTNLLQAIDNMDCSENFLRLNFKLRKYTKRGRKYPFYEMTRDGFSFLVMGFTGSRAAETNIVPWI